jgi:serine protease AprX
MKRRLIRTGIVAVAVVALVLGGLSVWGSIKVRWTGTAGSPPPGISSPALQKYVTGKGVGVAVIDKPILASHREFQGRIRYVEVFPEDSSSKRTHFHGKAAASILAGSTTGVAPGSFLHYYAVPDRPADVMNHEYATALRQMVKENESLPQEQRIQVVSISDGRFPQLKGVDEWNEALREAESSGIAVITGPWQRWRGRRPMPIGAAAA